jgi:hypothetical protein
MELQTIFQAGLAFAVAIGGYFFKRIQATLDRTSERIADVEIELARQKQEDFTGSKKNSIAFSRGGESFDNRRRRRDRLHRGRRLVGPALSRRRNAGLSPRGDRQGRLDL